ncbi:MAG: MBL fold metallo-hydrolase [Patescibacteria group bacterium]
MIINYLGNGSFKLQSGQTSLLVDAESNRFKADVSLRTLVSADLAPLSESSANTEITFPGEYEVKGIEISGIGVSEESTDKFLKTVYLVHWEDIKLAFLGHISKPLSPAIIEKLDEPDVLFIPVGGGHFLPPEDAAKLAKKLEPSFIVPSFYKAPGDFLKAMGQKAETEEKLVFKKKDLEGTKNKVVVLKT